MTNIIDFQHAVEQIEPLIWRCECGNASFRIYENGKVDCADCDLDHSDIEEHKIVVAKWTRKHKIGENDMTDSTSKQIGGNHYTNLNIQPVDYIVANALDFLQGSVIKYITRHKNKNGAEDIKKAIHFCEMILEKEYKELPNAAKD